MKSIVGICTDGCAHVLATTGLLAGLFLSPPPPASAQQQPPSPPTTFFRELTGAARPEGQGLDQYRCYETELGWLFTNDTARVVQTVVALRTAAGVFQARLGVPVGRGAILLREDGKAAVSLDSLKAAGAAWTFAWAADTGAGTDGPRRAGYLSMLRHEWGHTLYGARLARQPGLTPGAGEPSADWLAETVPVLLEDSASTSSRRQNLVDYFQEDQTGGGPPLIKPLETFFTMHHPLMPTRGSVNIQQLFQRFTANPKAAVAFYAQTRGFLDFLLQRATDPGVLSAIARNEAKGSNMIEWLGTSGPRYGLPATIAELEKEWQAWLGKGAPVK